jgi:hypothetical protein
MKRFAAHVQLYNPRDKVVDVHLSVDASSEAHAAKRAIWLARTHLHRGQRVSIVHLDLEHVPKPKPVEAACTNPGDHDPGCLCRIGGTPLRRMETVATGEYL